MSRFLDRAFAIAARVPPRDVSPNPRVGCVLVKGGRIVGEGAHRRFGGPHAEPTALAKAGTQAKGATAYVTMEPCVRFPGKKTPSCAQTLAIAGVAEVVCGSLDPNPAVAGKGLALLRKAGIKTRLESTPDSQRLNPGFFSRMRRGRPWVILKAALSLDGRAAADSGKSKWITGPEARAEGHRLRSRCDAILIGAGTLRADDPSLRSHGAGPNPLRVILAGRRPLPRKARAYPAEIYRRKTLSFVLRDLARRGIGTLLVEGGPKVHASFLRAGAVDEVRIFVAPKLLAGCDDPDRAPELEPTLRRIGSDWLFEGRL